MPPLAYSDNIINLLMESNGRMGTKKLTVSMTDEMIKALEEDRKVRKIATIPEVIRIIVSEYFKVKESH
jgi:hypothetical protein